MDFGTVLVATCFSAAIGTLIRGLWVNYPFVLAGMGLIAFCIYRGSRHEYKLAGCPYCGSCRWNCLGNNLLHRVKVGSRKFKDISVTMVFLPDFPVKGDIFLKKFHSLERRGKLTNSSWNRGNKRFP